MAELRLIPLEEVFGDDIFKKIMRELGELGVEELPAGDDEADLDESLSEDQLTDFLDRLDAHDLACDLYLPVEFEGVVEVGDQTIGSAYALLDALEELRDELDIENDGGDDDDEVDMEVIEEQLRFSWQVFLRSANTCIERQVPLHIIS